MKSFLLMLFILSLAITTFAEEKEVAESKTKLENESEASVSISSGNSEAESYIGKHSTKYTFEKNVFAVAGRYQAMTQNNVETTKSWDASLRYERAFSTRLSGYVGHKIESDIYAGYIQKTSNDIGGKYFFITGEPTEFFGEVGYRNTFEDNISPNENKVVDYVRLYSELSHKFAKTTSAKLWTEYLADLKEPEGYQINFEPSLNSVLTDVFSIKIAYLGKYSNTPAEGALRYDSLFTTALIAKY